MPAPAMLCTTTWWPWRISSRTLAGTSPTRYSWVLISLGTPMRMAYPPRFFSAEYGAGSPAGKAGWDATESGGQSMAIDWRRYRALTFDCYGTLIDWEAGSLAVLRPWAARHGLALGDEALLGAFGEVVSRIQGEARRTPFPEVLRARQR